MTISEWHKKIREAQSALDVGLRGDLPSPKDSIEIGRLRQLCQKLDRVLFEGFFLLTPAPKKIFLTLEDLEL